MKYIFIVFSLLSLHVYAGNENWSLGAKQAGMGFSGVTISDIWSSSHNQAALARISVPGIAIYHENRFLLNEMSLKAFSFALPTNEAGTFAIDLWHFGYTKYYEMKTGIAYGIMLGKKLSIGAKINYLHTYFAELYGKKSTMVAEIGFLLEAAENFFVGGHIYNISRSKLAVYDDERVPTILKAGIGYRFSEKLFMTTEAEKDLLYKIIFKVGVDYMFLSNLYIRAGATTSPDRMSFGLGYQYRKIRADIAFSYHQVLGISPHVGIIYNLKTETTANKAD
ncbi:MAG: hypothetical protein N2449_08310 [Bacteroidales bacterium]|nr:hypothetical protein [Bacteroidales bacterium]